MSRVTVSFLIFAVVYVAAITLITRQSAINTLAPSLPLLLGRSITIDSSIFLMTFIGLIWISGLILFLRSTRPDRPDPMKVYFVFALAGAAALIMSLSAEHSSFPYIEKVLGPALAQPIETALIAPLFEELISGFVVYFIINKMVHPVDAGDGFLYGATTGAGFLFMESLGRFSMIPRLVPVYFSIATASVVALAIILELMGHTIFCGLVGYFSARHMLQSAGRFNSPWLGLSLAIIAHSCWNTLVLTGYQHWLVMALPILVMILIYATLPKTVIDSM
jgi:RsiW-degrading membrane proteinase PrsW (M82 family)